MKYIQKILALWALFLMSAALISAQTENDLKNYFEGRRVEAKMDMPATKDGIDIYPERDREIDYSRYSGRLRQNGVGVQEGDRIMITKIKVKDKHIEFQLGGGGYGTFGDETTPSVFIPTVSKSERERSLEKNLKNESDNRRRRRMREELDYLRRDREETNSRNQAEAAPAIEIAKIRIQEKRLQAGSRFNIRFDRKLNAEDLTPEAIMDALSEYLYFADLR
jgi:hypothetical protein